MRNYGSSVVVCISVSTSISSAAKWYCTVKKNISFSFVGGCEVVYTNGIHRFESVIYIYQ